ncbi:ty3-gypsy retrotransposon protein [Cucumis melo var. makuwa]|uniref:Ty3-gypsy retrotransposon protein n=1 Tax=Cucumis melo var. makuwa TaxID=1194695 RepID=A0A5A7VG94_CUCMM|nr:ty3-gypsy retrotransposon protein [Cucumis melo var. makuwa]TYK26523.1 ty3-gypsy retrotransposon protein [Cucumis melo var. makuwa]
MTSKGNTSKALSDISKRPKTRSRSWETQSYEMPPFEVAKNIWEQLSKLPKDTTEDRMTKLEKKIHMLIKTIEEKDYEIASLKNHIESRNVAKSSHTHTVKNVDKGKAIIKKAPKFQQFDGKRNPKQHGSHFIETCETTGTRGDLLVKQFVRTLKGNAFNCMMELTNTRQRKGEPVIDYINRWRALSLDYMLELLVENQLIQLPKCKQLKQAGKVDDPNNCKYHRIISHPVEKCFVLKELILKLAREKKIELDIDEVA